MATLSKLTLRDLELLPQNSSLTYSYIFLLSRRLRRHIEEGRIEPDITDKTRARYALIRGVGGMPDNIDEYFQVGGKRHVGISDGIIDIIERIRSDLKRITIARYCSPLRHAKRDASGRIMRETALEIVALWKGGERTLESVAVEYGLSKNTVSRLFRSVKPATSLRRGRKRQIDYRRYPNVDGDEVVRLKLGGMTFEEVAAAMKSTKRIVYCVFHAMCPHVSMKKHGRRARIDYRLHPTIDGNNVVRLIEGEGQTIKSVAALIGVSRTTILKIFHAMRPNVDLRRDARARRERGASSTEVSTPVATRIAIAPNSVA